MTILQAALVGDLSLGSRYLGFASAMVPELVVMVMYMVFHVAQPTTVDLGLLDPYVLRPNAIHNLAPCPTTAFGKRKALTGTASG
jgi:hypothetical protein